MRLSYPLLPDGLVGFKNQHQWPGCDWPKYISYLVPFCSLKVAKTSDASHNQCSCGKAIPLSSLVDGKKTLHKGQLHLLWRCRSYSLLWCLIGLLDNHVAPRMCQFPLIWGSMMFILFFVLAAAKHQNGLFGSKNWKTTLPIGLDKDGIAFTDSGAYSSIRYNQICYNELCTNSRCRNKDQW